MRGKEVKNIDNLNYYKNQKNLLKKKQEVLMLKGNE